jgi:ATP-dependent RNA circularization protein (DNA/RNA ligase family)
MKYPKINTIWKRDPENKFKIMPGEYSCGEFRAISQWLITEKIDGTNIRIFINDGIIRFGGRTDRAQIPTFLFDYLQDTFTMERAGLAFDEPSEIILFGEGYGPKIQKGGGRYRDDPSFILFDVNIGGIWLDRVSVADIASKMGIDAVPNLKVMSTRNAVEYVEKGYPSAIAKDSTFIAEGIVARSRPLMLFRNGKPIMWKLKAKDFKC